MRFKHVFSRRLVDDLLLISCSRTEKHMRSRLHAVFVRAWDPDDGYTETTIVVKNSGEFVGEHVADCALNVCTLVSG